MSEDALFDPVAEAERTTGYRVGGVASTGTVMIGVLPTLAPGHFSPSTMSANPRYRLINEQIFAARGEDLHIEIDGPDRQPRIGLLADLEADRERLPDAPAHRSDHARRFERARHRLCQHGERL